MDQVQKLTGRVVLVSGSGAVATRLAVRDVRPHRIGRVTSLAPWPSVSFLQPAGGVIPVVDRETALIGGSNAPPAGVVCKFQEPASGVGDLRHPVGEHRTP